MIVFYADDDPEDYMLLKDSFAEISQEVTLHHFGNGLELLSRLDQITEIEEYPSLIVLDVNMPPLNGFEILLEIRKHQHLINIPVILYTTSSRSTEKVFAKKLNAEFMVKPAGISGLLQAAQYMINKIRG